MLISTTSGYDGIAGSPASSTNTHSPHDADGVFGTHNLDERAGTIKFLLRDPDTKFTAAFDAVLTASGIRILQSPVQAPRANAIMERWIGGCRRELLDHTLIWNQRHLLRVLREYEAHHNQHRPHRSLNQAAPLKPKPAPVSDLNAFRVRRHDRVGGLIHEYTLAA